MSPLRRFSLTCLSLTGFAANSLLCRAALLREGTIDPVSFTSLRLLSGAVALALLTRLMRKASPGQPTGSWASALALFGYAIAFSTAYVRLTTGTGALILFTVVQLTMLVVAYRRGERMSALQWLGFSVAFCGLISLVFPGLRAPDPLSAAMMTVAGICWAIYTLRGKGQTSPLAVTASNFLRSVPVTLVASLLAISVAQVSPRGALLAIASGAIASGIGYTLWYTVLPHITASHAAFVQPLVPIIAAGAGILLFGEALTARIVAGAVLTLSGVLLATRKPSPVSAAR